jgi:4-hydroxy-2-oxoheptanedioate aldolase
MAPDTERRRPDRGGTFRERLGRGGLLGTWMMIPGPALVEILGIAGFDFVIADLEHSQFGLDAARDLVIAGDAVDLPVVVRVHGLDSPDIARALDLGAAGVMVPRIESADEARRAVRASKFAPLGERGACPRARGARYGLTPMAEYYATENDRRVTIVLVESPKGLASLPEIVAVEGVDAIFFGFTDLSQAMGHPGQPDHPTVRAAIDAALGRTRASGRFAGLSCYDGAEAARRLAAGLDFVTVAGAERLFLEACRAVVGEVRAGRPSHGRP